jgi:hypothetical protein
MAASTSLKKPVDFDELYPGKFLKAGELLGKKVTLTVSGVTLEELEGDDGKKIKGVISFKETAKMLCLNKTNGLCLRAMFGRKLADWEGKRVTIFSSTWNGEDCIRIWGSPDIQRDEEIVIQLPRKKPTKMVMHRVAPNGAAKGNGAKPPPAPADSDGEPPEGWQPDGEREPGQEG